MKIKILFLFISLFLVITACVKPYDVVIDKYENIIVIDGVLLDDGTPPKVNIKYSGRIGGAEIKMVVGAVVYIVTSNGQKFNLTEKEKGFYTYQESMFPVTQGVSYGLVVEYDGHVYKSTMEKVIPSSPITDLSFQIKNDSKGVDLLISSDNIDSASRYYSWQLSETWKFRIPIYSNTRSVNKEICYATTKNELELGTTELFSKNCFNRFPFLFIPVTSPKLYYRYSILVEQLSISRNTYIYLNHIKKINETEGSLFDPIPSNLNGNITCENAQVIGNFQVSSIMSKRIYIDRSDLPKEITISSGMEDCKLDMSNNRRVIDSLSQFMTIIDTIADQNGNIVRFSNWQRCFDCTATGFPNTPPSWWEEKK